MNHRKIENRKIEKRNRKTRKNRKSKNRKIEKHEKIENTKIRKSKIEKSKTCILCTPIGKAFFPPPPKVVYLAGDRCSTCIEKKILGGEKSSTFGRKKNFGGGLRYTTFLKKFFFWGETVIELNLKGSSNEWDRLSLFVFGRDFESLSFINSLNFTTGILISETYIIWFGNDWSKIYY